MGAELKVLVDQRHIHFLAFMLSLQLSPSQLSQPGQRSIRRDSSNSEAFRKTPPGPPRGPLYALVGKAGVPSPETLPASSMQALYEEGWYWQVAGQPILSDNVHTGALDTGRWYGLLIPNR